MIPFVTLQICNYFIPKNDIKQEYTFEELTELKTNSKSEEEITETNKKIEEYDLIYSKRYFE